MDALDPKQSPNITIAQPKQSKSKKNLWESVKGIFTKTQEEPQPQSTPTPQPKKYANYTTPKIYPESLGVRKRVHESVHTVYRNHKQFLDIDDFTNFLKETRPIPQTLKDFQKILSANASYLSQRNYQGKTPFSIAVEFNNIEAVQYILEELLHYIDQYQEKHHQMVLFKAIENKNFRIVELLMQPGFIVYGEQYKMLNERGKNAAEYALEVYRNALPEHKFAAWNIAYFIIPDLPARPADYKTS